jgi:hypothetical protein
MIKRLIILSPSAINKPQTGFTNVLFILDLSIEPKEFKGFTG